MPINLALKLTQPLFNPKSSLSKHSHDNEYSSITIAFENVQCSLLLLLLRQTGIIGLPITIYDRPTYYYYHPMFGYIAPLPIMC